jgi:large subunit ribosomal protein L19
MESVMDLVQQVALKYSKKAKLPDFTPGDTIGVYVKVREGEKERVQLYKGVVLKIQGSGAGRSFTVRKISSGVGVERTFPFISPSIDRIEVISVGKVRRSKLYYLRGLKGRAARLESDMVQTDGGTSGASQESAETSTENTEKA